MDTSNRLTRLSVDMGATKAEVMRKAIELVSVIREAESDGNALAVVRRDTGVVKYRLKVLGL